MMVAGAAASGMASAATTILRKAAVSSSSSGVLLHPVLFTIAPRQSYQTLLRRHFMSPTASSTFTAQERCRMNGSKLYSRYVLTLLSLQLATENSIARLEQAVIEKPTEWGRSIDVLKELEDQEIATYKAGLGRTAVSRVFNAGKCTSWLGLLVVYCNCVLCWHGRTLRFIHSTISVS